MAYTFTTEQLVEIKNNCDKVSLRHAYSTFANLHNDVATSDVEDFALAFYSQYNDTFGLTY